MTEADKTTQPDRAVEVGHGVLFIGFAKASFMVFGALQKFLLARVVDLAEYGAFSVVNNAISIVNNTIVQGTIQSVSKFTAEDDARAGAVQRAGLKLQSVLGVAVAVAFFLAAPLVAGFVNAPEHTSLFRLAAAIPLIYAFYTVFVGTANGQRRFHVQASFDVGFSITKTALLLAGAALGHMAGHSVAGAFAGFIAAAVVIMLVAGHKMWLDPGQGRFSPARLLVFMGGAVTYTGLINLALSYDSLLLRRFAGAALMGQGSKADALVGVYEAVRSLALLPYQALLVVTFVIFPLVFLAVGKSVNSMALISIPSLLLVVINLTWVALILGVLCTRYRDLPQIVGSILQILFYLTPIMWMPNLLPQRTGLYLLDLNPAYHLLQIVRAPLLGKLPTLLNWEVSFGLALIGWIMAIMFYGRYKRRIAYWL